MGTKLAKCQSDQSSQTQGSPPAGHLVSRAQLQNLNIRKGHRRINGSMAVISSLVHGLPGSLCLTRL